MKYKKGAVVADILMMVGSILVLAMLVVAYTFVVNLSASSAKNSLELRWSALEDDVLLLSYLKTPTSAGSMADLILLYQSNPAIYRPELESATKQIMNAYSMGLCWRVLLPNLVIYEKQECNKVMRQKASIELPTFTDQEILVSIEQEVKNENFEE